MRIIHAVRQFHPSVGGLESVVMELARAQMERGHSLRVVTLDRVFNAPDRRRLAANESISGIEIIRIPFHGSTRYPLAPSILRHIGNADILHVHAIDFFFDYLAWTKPIHRRPLVASTHGAFFHTPFAATLKRIYFHTVTRLSAACYDMLVAVSPADHDLFSTISSKVVCIENGVNVQRFLAAGSATPRKRIVAIGRFSFNKRLDRLISCFAELHSRDPEWSLVIAGRASDLVVADLMALTARAGVGNCVSIVEAPSDDELRRIVHECSVLASASDYEGFGLAAVEGMAAGLFPLLSDIPPYRRLVTSTGVGMVVDFSDPEGATGSFLQRWTEVTERYGKMRSAAIEASLSYEWGPVAAKYLQLYESVLARSARPDTHPAR
ncbi:MAG TPA: glycosyltransferase family 4 protein [Xanthobacteraceae bacterium]|nr:glycosyltransferase family 4 protein [Xanthobacteraceae bacterium]